jgi:hypothetical protein
MQRNLSQGSHTREYQETTKDRRFSIYEQLWLLSQYCLELIAFLRTSKGRMRFPENESPYYLALAEEVRASASRRLETT